VSCESPEASRAALQYPGVSSIQVAVNLLYRGELEAIRRAAAQGVAVIGRESLANGLLVKDVTRAIVRTYVETDEDAARKADAIERWRTVASRNGQTIAQLALAYVNGLDGIGVTLIGASRLAQLHALAAAGLPSREAARGERSLFSE
jgi:aryl-alcohol dehydrogenase-like predicted oxidoreductase